MENVFDVGVKPYRAAASHNPQSVIDIVKLIFELVIDLFMFLVLSIPAYLKLLKDLVTPVKQKEIAGQLALVTGGANGLGRSICLELAKEGCNVAVVDLDEVNAAKTVAECEKFNVKARAYKADVSVFSAVKELNKNVETDLGPVDILVNNAAVLPLVSLREGTERDLDRIIDVNFKSHVWTIRVFIESMIRRKKGHIVGIASLTAMNPQARMVTYSATKAGVRGLYEALYEELCVENFDKGIFTTTVYPYFVRTRHELVDVVSRFTRIYRKIPLLTPDYVAKQTVDAIKHNVQSLMVPRAFNILQFSIFNAPIPIRKLAMSLLNGGEPTQRLME